MIVGMYGKKISDKYKGECFIKILILGSTGMLGNAVAKYFLSNENYEVITTYRHEEYKFEGNTIYFDALTSDFSVLPDDVDYVINCIGIIKPFMAKSIENAIMINSLFPHRLAKWCEEKGIKLIHITTDCVFSGMKGKYTENDLHDALDEYGKSKSLGECVNNAMVIRTSIIGEEIHNNASLIEWAKSQKGKTVNGFVNHLWNGVTTKQYAVICDKIISQGLYEKGLFHAYAADDVTKYEMMQYFNKKFDLNLTINEFEASQPCDRTLRSDKELCKKLEIPTVSRMIEEM
ncbi:MAG: SDR family oxidoreductase [Oscillospiraceae bacterium]|nr:SDR family oxidoreductase [Oscillospiraceae bacterium]